MGQIKLLSVVSGFVCVCVCVCVWGGVRGLIYTNMSSVGGGELGIPSD